MQKLTITIALAVIALALGTTTITTPMQIQPANSQVTHCTTVTGREQVRTDCITPGQNPTATVCIDEICRDQSLTGQQAGQIIARGHQGCAQGIGECTITHP